MIFLAGRTSTFTQRVALDPGNTSLQVSPATSSVRILIGEKVDSKTIDGVPIELGDAGAHLQVRPKTIKVTVTGPVRPLRSLTAKGIQATLRRRDLARLPSDIEPVVTLRTSAMQTVLKVRSIEPSRVTVVPEVAVRGRPHKWTPEVNPAVTPEVTGEAAPEEAPEAAQEGSPS